MLPLTIEITDQNGIQWRPPFRNLKFAKTFFGGEDLWMVFVLDRAGNLDYPDIGYGNDVVLRNGLKPLFAGEMREIESDLETVTVKALGRWVYLDDYSYGGMGKLWAESRYGKWRPVTTDILATRYPERYAMDNQNRIYITIQRNEFSSPNFRGALYFQCQYQNIYRVSFDVDVEEIGNWDAHLRAWDSAWGASDLLWNWQAAGVEGVLDIDLPTPRPILEFALWNIAGDYGPDSAGLCYVKVTNLRLWGEEGPLNLAIENPSVIHVAEDIIGQVQAATPISAEEDLVQESLFVRDTFTDANGTSLDAHGPDIDKELGGWTEDAGDWTTQAQQANIVAQKAIATIDSGVADGIVCVDIRSVAAGLADLGLIFRYQDANNYWWWRFRNSGEAELARWVGGVKTDVWSQNIGMELGGYWYHLMVKLRGRQIDCYIGGVWRCGTNSGIHITATRHGMYGGRADAVGARFDNFEVFQAFPIWPLFYEEGQSCHDALEDMASYGDWDFRALGWGIEPGGDKLYVRKADRSRVRYVVPSHHASRLSARGQTDKDFITEAWGQYTDEDGVEQWTDKYYAHVTPTGIEANTTAIGDDLASNVYGVVREEVIDFGRVTARLAAEYLGRYLVEHAHPRVKSSFEIFGPVQDLDKGGAWIQPYEIEMGYVVQIPYFRAVEVEGVAGSDIREWDTTFLLVAMQYDAESGKAKLIPEGESEDLERIMEYTRRFGRRTERQARQKRKQASFPR